MATKREHVDMGIKRAINTLYYLVKHRLMAEGDDWERATAKTSKFLDDAIYIPGGYGWEFVRRRYIDELNYLEAQDERA